MTGIIDYNGGNIGSLMAMLDTINKNYILTSDLNKLLECSHIILPGVGSFDSVANSLRNSINMEELIYEVHKSGIPFLGICVGMQLLAKYGTENGITKGLGIIEGKVEKLTSYLPKNLKVPHIGWNNIYLNKFEGNFPAIEHLDFYHIHSYFLNPTNDSDIVAYVSYGMKIPVIVQKDNFIGVQFHPEKSQESGLIFFQEIFYKSC